MIRTARFGLAPCTFALLSMLAVAPSAQAAESRALKVIVGTPPGGTTDTLARLLANGMTVEMKRPVVVENRPGVGGNIAAHYVSRQPPDGETIYMAFTSHTINPSLYKDLPWDAVRDFTPITMVARVPSVLVANSRVPVNSVADLLDYARKHPAKLNFAIGGIGSSIHLAGEQLKAYTGVDIVNVPYKGTGPALNDVMGGQVELMFASAVAVLPHLGSGKIKALGVTSTESLPQLPNVPPIGATVPGFSSSAWFGLVGPAGMPAAVLEPLYRAARRVIDSPEFQQRLAAEAAQRVSMTPDEFRRFLEKDVQTWAAVVAKSGAKVD